MNVYIGTYSRLPSEYQEVEYIQTTWTQFINTWLLAWNNIQTEAKIEVTTTSQNIPLFWCYGPSVNYRGGNYYHLTPYSSKWYFGLNGSEWNGGTYSPTVWTQYTIVFNNSAGYLNVNWSNIVSVSWTAGRSWTTLSISLRSDKEWGSTTHNFFGQYKYFYFKMYNKTTWAYERDLVPCYRKSGGVIWMYDLVNDQFYTNSWTGTFDKWADVYTNMLKNIYIGEYTNS